MLLVKTALGTSSIHGIGLFANQPIPKGTIVWRFSPMLDREISVEAFAQLSNEEKDYISFYGFLSRKSGNYHLSFDNVKFLNHEIPGNVACDTSATHEIEFPLIATRDIQIGEELAQNYKQFEEEGHGL